jgi:transposase, IS30 family
VSFSEDCVRFGDRLRGLVETGVAVKDAAAALGMSGHRCYAILRATGHPMGASRPGRGRVDRERIVVVFTATGSTKAAATASGISASAARGVLVAEGLVEEARRPRDKVAAKRRFLELVGSGWSARRAARGLGSTNALAGIGATAIARAATRGFIPTARSWITRPVRVTHLQ